MAAAAVLIPLPSVVSAQTADSPEITKMLSEVKSHAALAKDDAMTLESYTWTSMSSKQSHSLRLIAIKDHANDLINDFNKLHSMRAEGSAWQREAVDRISPLLQDMSNHLTATMNYLKSNPSVVQAPAFSDYVRSNRIFIGDAYRVISDFIDYGEAKAEVDSLEKALGMLAQSKVEKQ
jgi:hypothetical protein